MTSHQAPIRRALILMDGVERARRPLNPDDHPAFRLVRGRPIVDHLVHHLVSQGIEKICLVVHHLPGLVVHFFADGAPWGVHVTYVYEQRPLGSAGAVAQAAAFCSEPTLVLPGAVVTRVPVKLLSAAHHGFGSPVTLAVALHQGGRPRPSVLLDNEGFVTQYAPRPAEAPGPQGLVDGGVCLVDPAVIQRVPKDTFVDWSRDIMPQMVQELLVRGWRSESPIIHVATAEDAQLAAEVLDG